MPNVKQIRGLTLPGTPWATSACCGKPLPFYLYLLEGFISVRITNADGGKMEKSDVINSFCRLSFCSGRRARKSVWPIDSWIHDPYLSSIFLHVIAFPACNSAVLWRPLICYQIICLGKATNITFPSLNVLQIGCLIVYLNRSSLIRITIKIKEIVLVPFLIKLQTILPHFFRNFL